jgi:hypothetical protein
LLFKTLYKYDAAGRLERETHLAKDDRVIQTLVYRYDAQGAAARGFCFRCQRQASLGCRIARVVHFQSEIAQPPLPLTACRLGEKGLRK